MLRLTMIALTPMVASCYSLNTFWEDRAMAQCQLYEQCGYLSYVGAETFDDCFEAMTDTEYDCSDYNQAAARECVEGQEAMSCQDLEDGYYPTACTQVCTTMVQVTE